MTLSFFNITKNRNINNGYTNFTENDISYIVREFEGNVAVFKTGSDLPFQVLDCKIKNLPPDAAEALATGIEVSGEDELQKIIEAYD